MDSQVSRVVVMGPGRSGSKYMRKMMWTLAFDAIHEGDPRGTFTGGKYVDDCDWEGALAWLQKMDRRALVGFPYGFMVYYFRHHIPDLRVICVHREEDDWEKSQSKYVKTAAGATGWPRGMKNFKQYWTLYEHLMASISPPVLHLDMKDLNKCKSRIAEFVE